MKAVPALKAISVQLEAAASLQRILHVTLPPPLAACSRLIPGEDGVVVISASQAGAAARLRMLTPRVLKALRTADPGVKEIRIVVEVLRQSGTPPAPARRLDAAAMAAWRQLANSLPDGGLQRACKKLIGGQEALYGDQKPLENQKGKNDCHDQ